MSTKHIRISNKMEIEYQFTQVSEEALILFS